MSSFANIYLFYVGINHNERDQIFSINAIQFIKFNINIKYAFKRLYYDSCHSKLNTERMTTAITIFAENNL